MSVSDNARSIFARIIANEIPSYRVAEDAHFIAFLDIRPLAVGHTLVVPKKQLDYIFHYDDETLATLMVFAKKVALAIQQCVPCQRIGMAVVGFEVPHAHVHLVPLHTMNDINFSNTKLELSPEKFIEVSTQISDAFRSANTP